MGRLGRPGHGSLARLGQLADGGGGGQRAGGGGAGGVHRLGSEGRGLLKRIIKDEARDFRAQIDKEFPRPQSQQVFFLSPNGDLKPRQNIHYHFALPILPI